MTPREEYQSIVRHLYNTEIRPCHYLQS